MRRTMLWLAVGLSLGAIGCASTSRTAKDDTTVTTSRWDSPTLTSSSVATPGTSNAQAQGAGPASEAPRTGTAPAPAAENAPTARADQSPQQRDLAPRWSDEQIVAALAAIAQTEEQLAREVRHDAKSARVARLADQIVFDARELSASRANVAKTIPAAPPGDIGAKVDDARRELSRAVKSAPAADYDRTFLAAEERWARSMIQLIDAEMMPNARRQELKSQLQATRSKLNAHVLATQEIASQLP